MRHYDLVPGTGFIGRDLGNIYNIRNKLFEEIVSQSDANPPILKAGNITMNLADGTPSNNVLGCAEISKTRPDKPDRTGIYSLFLWLMVRTAS